MKHTIYKTVSITTKSPNEIIKELKKRGDYVSSYAKDIASKIKPKEETVNLVMVKLSDWFTSYPTTTEIFNKAEKKGLELCPPATGLQLRLDLTEQEKGDYFWVGMETITDSGGYPSVFIVERDGGGERWLDTSWARPHDTWRLGYRFVFRLRKDTLNSDTGTLGTELVPLELESAIKMVKEAGYQVAKII